MAVADEHRRCERAAAQTGQEEVPRNDGAPNGFVDRNQSPHVIDLGAGQIAGDGAAPVRAISLGNLAVESSRSPKMRAPVRQASTHEHLRAVLIGRKRAEAALVHLARLRIARAPDRGRRPCSTDNRCTGRDPLRRCRRSPCARLRWGTRSRTARPRSACTAAGCAPRSRWGTCPLHALQSG